MSYYDDPLFLEDWRLKTGRTTVVYRPVFGPRTWDIDPQALAELREHTSTAVLNSDGTYDDANDTLIRLHCESALDGLDGYSGQLGVVLQTRTVNQNYGRIAREMDLIGPVQFQPNSPYPGFNLEYRANAQSTTWTALTMNEDYTVSDEVHTWKIRLTEQGIKKTPYYTETDYAGAPLARLEYTAGMADNISGLPADLRLAIYTLARRSFDFRDDTMPTSMAGLTKGGFLPTGVASTIARYTKNLIM